MCNCIDTINAQLAAVSRPLVPLIRLDKWEVETRRSKPRDVAASFCPWCGEKYPEPPKPEAD
ncbi:hypothetical protein [Xanthobacter sediminis]